MSEQEPEPVMIPVAPRFDPEGKPSCYGCPFSWVDYGGYIGLPERKCSITGDAGDPGEPYTECPIHPDPNNPEAREGMEPL